jgi:hypothetical protein
MNIGDWILYMGTQAGIWLPDRCYEWTGAGWKQVGFNEMDKYMAAVSDMTEGRDNAAFMAVFCRMLWAQKAMIDRLEAEIITIKKGGGIQSWNWSGTNGDEGYYIDGDTGNVFFNDGTFRGNIKALLGTLENIKITKNATLDGDITIKSGRFQIVPDKSETKSYSNITASNLRSAIANDFNIPASDVYSVSYGMLSLNGQQFDTIVFSNNLVTFYRNSAPIAQSLNGLGTSGITITIGSTDMIMIYNAPDSTGKKDGVYRFKDIPGVILLAIQK